MHYLLMARALFAIILLLLTGAVIQVLPGLLELAAALALLPAQP